MCITTQEYILCKMLWSGRGGGGGVVMSALEKKWIFRGKNELDEGKTEKNYIKNGKKALKMHLFGL